MLILDPAQIRNDKERGAEETRERISNLRKAESEANFDVNMAKMNAEQEQEKIAENIKKIRENHDRVIRSLTQEVETLENRKIAALLPITALQEEVEKASKENERRALDLDKREQEIVTAHSKFMDEMDKIKDYSDDVKHREEKVIVRENAIEQERARLQDSSQELSARWTDFHEAVHVKNNEMDARENELINREKIVEIDKKENHRIKYELIEKERGIKDGYAQLEKSRIEILGRTT